MADKPHQGDMSEMVWRLMEAERYVEARAMLLRRLKDEPENHWLLTRVGTTHYEERDYENALKYHEKALRLAPKCPLVVWDYAGTIDMLGRNEEAIRIWKGLTRQGVRSIARGECGEGTRRARSLVNDSRYRIGKAYAAMGRAELATRYLKAYIANRGPNCDSIYNLREVRKALKDIEGKRMAGSTAKDGIARQPESKPQ